MKHLLIPATGPSILILLVALLLCANAPTVAQSMRFDISVADARFPHTAVANTNTLANAQNTRLAIQERFDYVRDNYARNNTGTQIVIPAGDWYIDQPISMSAVNSTLTGVTDAAGNPLTTLHPYQGYRGMPLILMAMRNIENGLCNEPYNPISVSNRESLSGVLDGTIGTRYGLRTLGQTPAPGEIRNGQTVPEARGSYTASNPPSWASGTNYTVGTCVLDNGGSYYCYIAHLSDATNRPFYGANWQNYWVKYTLFNGYFNSDGLAHGGVDANNLPSYWNGLDRFTLEFGFKWNKSQATGGVPRCLLGYGRSVYVGGVWTLVKDEYDRLRFGLALDNSQGASLNILQPFGGVTGMYRLTVQVDCVNGTLTSWLTTPDGVVHTTATTFTAGAHARREEKGYLDIASGDWGVNPHGTDLDMTVCGLHAENSLRYENTFQVSDTTPSGQLTKWKIDTVNAATDTTNDTIYWRLRVDGCGLFGTDRRYVELFRDAAMTDMVAQGSTNIYENIPLAPVGSHGVSGSVWINEFGRNWVSCTGTMVVKFERKIGTANFATDNERYFLNDASTIGFLPLDVYPTATDPLNNINQVGTYVAVQHGAGAGDASQRGYGYLTTNRGTCGMANQAIDNLILDSGYTWGNGIVFDNCLSAHVENVQIRGGFDGIGTNDRGAQYYEYLNNVTLEGTHAAYNCTSDIDLLDNITITPGRFGILGYGSSLTFTNLTFNNPAKNRAEYYVKSITAGSDYAGGISMTTVRDNGGSNDPLHGGYAGNPNYPSKGAFSVEPASCPGWPDGAVDQGSRLCDIQLDNLGAGTAFVDLCGSSARRPLMLVNNCRYNGANRINFVNYGDPCWVVRVNDCDPTMLLNQWVTSTVSADQGSLLLTHELTGNAAAGNTDLNGTGNFGVQNRPIVKNINATSGPIERRCTSTSTSPTWMTSKMYSAGHAAPTVTLTMSPSWTNPATGAVLTFTATPIDADNDIDELGFYLDADKTPFDVVRQRGFPSGYAYATTWTVPDQYQHTITVRALDAYYQAAMASISINVPIPIPTSGLLCWLKADALSLNNNDPVNTWTDSSVNNRNAVSIGGTAPVFTTNVFNGKPVVRFNGTNWLQVSALPLGPYTIATVFKSSGNSQMVYEHGANAAAYDGCFLYTSTYSTVTVRRGTQTGKDIVLSNAGTWAANLGAPVLTIDQFDGTDAGEKLSFSGSAQLLNENIVGNINNTTPITADFNIAARYGGWLNLQGDIAEIVVYDHVLNAADLTMLQNAMNSKYALNTPPMVSLTSPANNASYTAPATIPLAATASDSDGTISKVEFYNGATLVGTATSSPYSYTWTNVAAGNYTLTALAYDNLGFTTVSTPVNVTVSSLPMTGMLLWLKADALALNNGDPVNTWTDSSGNGRNAVLVSNYGQVAPVYTTNVFNGRPVVRFNGNSLLQVPSLPMGPFSIITVFKATGSTTEMVYEHSDNSIGNDGGFLYTSTNSTISVKRGTQTGKDMIGSGASTWAANITAPMLAINTFDGTDAGFKLYLNNSLQPLNQTYTGNINSQNVVTAHFNIGERAVYGNCGLHGDIAEIIIYDHVLNSTDLNTLNTSLFNKYALDTPPTVSLTSPANNASYTAPASITCTATASDCDGTVSKVEFYNGATLVGTATSSPYSATWTNVAAGTYTITALAYDNQGFTTVSGTANITVTAGPVITAAIGMTGAVRLTWSAFTGATGYKVERSPNGSTGWVQIATTGSASTALDNTGLTASTTYYYRLRATTGGGDSAYGNIVSAATSATTPPSTLFADACDGSSLNSGWTTWYGTWGESGGTIAQTDTTTAHDPVKLVLSNAGTLPTVSTICAKMRIDSWTGGDGARAGVSLCSGTGNGTGYCLLVHNNLNTVQFLADYIAWGNSYTFTFTLGKWYWFKLKRDTDGTLYGKIWEDGTDEPATWPFSQTGWTYYPSGYPALVACSPACGGSCATAYDEVTVTNP